jgi:EAL domain-containing protein (putative c-di-GMP-specific phosphodiesterase class I)
VETVGQLEFLRRQGCDQVQGHWFSPPLDADDCLAFIRQRQAGAAPTG